MRERVTGNAKEMFPQAESLCLVEGMRGKSPGCLGYGNFLTEGTFKSRDLCSIV